MPDQNDDRHVPLDGAFQAKIAIDTGVFDPVKKKTLDNIVIAVAKSFTGALAPKIVKTQLYATANAIKAMPEASAASMENLLKPIRRGNNNKIPPSETGNVQQFAQALAEGNDFTHAVPEPDLHYLIESGQFHELLPRIYDETNMSPEVRKRIGENFGRAGAERISGEKHIKNASYASLRGLALNLKDMISAANQKDPSFYDKNKDSFAEFFDTIFVKGYLVSQAAKLLSAEWAPIVAQAKIEGARSNQAPNVSMNVAMGDALKSVLEKAPGADEAAVNDYTERFYNSRSQHLRMSGVSEDDKRGDCIPEPWIDEAIQLVLEDIANGNIPYNGEIPADVKALAGGGAPPPPPPPGPGGSGGGAPPPPPPGREISIDDAVALIDLEILGKLVSEDVRRMVMNYTDYKADAKLQGSDIDKLSDEIQKSANPRELVPYKFTEAVSALYSAGLPEDKLRGLGGEEVTNILRGKAGISASIVDVTDVTVYGNDVDKAVQDLKDRFAASAGGTPPPPGPGGSGGSGGGAPPSPPKGYSIDEAVSQISGKIAGRLPDDDVKRIVMKEVDYKADTRFNDSFVNIVAGAIQTHPNPRQSVPYKLEDAIDAVFSAGIPQDKLNDLGRDGVKNEFKSHGPLDPDIPGGGVYGTTVDNVIGALTVRFSPPGGSGGGAPPPPDEQKYAVDDAVAKLLAETHVPAGQNISADEMRGVLLYQTKKAEDAEFDDADIDGVSNTLAGTATPRDYIPRSIEYAIKEVKSTVLHSKRKGASDDTLAQKLRGYAGVAADAPQVLEKDIAAVIAELKSASAGGTPPPPPAPPGGSGGGAPPPDSDRGDIHGNIPIEINAAMSYVNDCLPTGIHAIDRVVLGEMLRQKAGVGEDDSEIKQGDADAVLQDIINGGTDYVKEFRRKMVEASAAQGGAPPARSPDAAPKKEREYGPIGRRPLESMYFKEFASLIHEGFIGVKLELEPRNKSDPADVKRKPKTRKTDGFVVPVPECAIAYAVNWHYFRKGVKTDDEKTKKVREFVNGKGVLDAEDITDLLCNTMPLLNHHAKTKDGETGMVVSEDDFISQSERIPGKAEPLKELILKYSGLMNNDKSQTQKIRELISTYCDMVWAANPDRAAAYPITSSLIEWGRTANITGTAGNVPKEISDLIDGAEQAAVQEEAKAKTGIFRWVGRGLAKVAGLVGYGRKKESDQEKLLREIAEEGIPQGYAISLDDLYENITDNVMNDMPEGTDRNAERAKIAAAFRENHLLPYAHFVADIKDPKKIAGILLSISENEALYSDFKLGREQVKGQQFADLEKQLAVWATKVGIGPKQKREKKELRKLVRAYTDVVPYTLQTKGEGRKKVTEVDMDIGERIEALWNAAKQEAEKPQQTGGLDQADILVNICRQALKIDPFDDYENQFVDGFVGDYISQHGTGVFGLDKGKKDALVNECGKALESDRAKRRKAAGKAPEPAAILPDDYTGNLDAALAAGMLARDFCDDDGNAIPQSDIEKIVAGIPKKKEKKGGKEVVSGTALYDAAIANWRSRDKEAAKTRTEMEAVARSGSKVIRIFNKPNIADLFNLVGAASLEYTTHLNKDHTAIAYTGEDEQAKKVAQLNLEYHAAISKPDVTAVGILLAYTGRKHKDIELMTYALRYAKKDDELKRDLDAAKSELESVQRKLEEAGPGKVRELQEKLEKYKADYEGVKRERDDAIADLEEKERTVVTLERAHDKRHQNEIRAARRRKAISYSIGATAAAAVIAAAVWGYSQIDDVKSYLASRSHHAQVMRNMDAQVQRRGQILDNMADIFKENPTQGE